MVILCCVVSVNQKKKKDIYENQKNLDQSVPGQQGMKGKVP